MAGRQGFGERGGGVLGGQRAQQGSRPPLLSLVCLCSCMSHIPSVPTCGHWERDGIEVEIWAVLVQPTLAPNVD